MNFSEEHLFHCGVIVCLLLVSFFCAILTLISSANVIPRSRNFATISSETGKLIGSTSHRSITHGLQPFRN